MKLDRLTYLLTKQIVIFTNIPSFKSPFCGLSVEIPFNIFIVVVLKGWGAKDLLLFVQVFTGNALLLIKRNITIDTMWHI